MPYIKVANRKKATYSAEVIAKYSDDKHAPFKCNSCDKVCNSEPSLVMHHRRAHGNMKVPNEAGSPVNSEFVLSTEVEKPKRKWTRRSQPEVIEANSRPVNYCPCCGTNIQAVAVALSIR